MSASDEPDVIDRTTRTLQLIVAALVMGLVSFLAVVVFLRMQPTRPNAAAVPPAQEPALPVLTVTAITLTAIALPLSFVLPGILSESSSKKLAAETPSPASDVARVAAIYQSQKIVGAALGEFPSFLALIAYLLEGNPIALALGVLLIACVALRFPQREAVARWVEDRVGRVEAYRQTGRFS